MLTSFADTTVTVVNPAAGSDARNNPTLDYNVAGVTVEGCIPLAGAVQEVFGGGRDTAVIAWTLLVPPGTVIGPTSAVDLFGRRYYVEGDAQPWQSPTGSINYLAVQLKGHR